MISYILRRLLYLLPVCIGILLVTFLIKAAIPTDAVSMLYSGQLTEETSAEAEAIIRAEFHLDQPALVQFFYYVTDILRGDLGVSVRTREPVIDLIGYRYLNTLKLAFASLAIGVILGVGTGIISAYYKDTFFDVTAMTVSLFGLSMPAFFLGILLILFFCVELRWLPVIGDGSWKHLLLPSLNLGLILSASLARITRSSMLEVLDLEYIRTARAKGLNERLVVFKHALKNALLPVITIIGLQIGGLLGGAFIIENVFAWHGIGELAVKAIIWRDFTITQGIILISAATYVLANLVVDILYQVIDPRVRLAG
ncbi:MAG: ABC transporter permease [Chloroflexi bacterium]|nr:ABC transporter permease [Chloroflexota bacterium]